jgi:hypothetical protein
MHSLAVQAGAQLCSQPPTPDQMSLPVMLVYGAAEAETLLSNDILRRRALSIRYPISWRQRIDVFGVAVAPFVDLPAMGTKRRRDSRCICVGQIVAFDLNAGRELLPGLRASNYKYAHGRRRNR